MGCAQSKVDNEEAVSRCKERRNIMKEALAARNAFAAGHSGYSMALKNTGAALSDYARGEAEIHESLQGSNDNNDDVVINGNNNQKVRSLHGGGGVPNKQTMDSLPPPPPPLPNFSPSPLKRSSTLPAFAVSGTVKKDVTSGNDVGIILEEIEEGEDVERLRPRRNKRNGEGKERKEGEKGNGKSSVVQTPSPPMTPPITPLRPPPPDLKGAWDYFFMDNNMPSPLLEEVEEEDDKEESQSHNFSERVSNMNMRVIGGFVGNGGVGGVKEIDELEQMTPEKVMEEVGVERDENNDTGKKGFVHSNTAPPEFKRGTKVVSSINLLKLLEAVDDHFLKAYESAQEVSKMLEANRLHYHSNFADNSGHIDHSARVMRVITWNRSFKGAGGGTDDFEADDFETHAIVLDKLVAWEKKLYEEVKTGELMKLEYQKKVALLTKQRKRGASAETLEKTKAAVSHLHTRYIVDMQSMDSTVSEVHHIRDHQLYPKLVALAEGMANMWESMSSQHDRQLQIVTELKTLEIVHVPQETNKHHHEQTIQLWNAVQEWSSQFEKLVTFQKQYIHALNSWLKLNLVPIESTLKEKVSSPTRVQTPPIQYLLHSWNDLIDKIPDELAKTAISSFAAVIKTIIDHQDEEMKLKEKYDETRRDYLRKKQVFEEWYQKYMQRKGPQDEMDPDRSEDVNTKDPILERQFVVESLKKRLEEDMEAYQRHCLQVREKSLGSLKTRLPELFRALSDYTHACSDAYARLKFVTQSGNRNASVP